MRANRDVSWPVTNQRPAELPGSQLSGLSFFTVLTFINDANVWRHVKKAPGVPHWLLVLEERSFLCKRFQIELAEKSLNRVFRQRMEQCFPRCVRQLLKKIKITFSVF